jgi:hypothetical protein
MTSTSPSIHRRIRVSFDLDADYYLNPIDESNSDLIELRSRLLNRDDLFQKMLVNQCLHKLESHLGGMIVKGGLLGYDAQDLVNIVGRSMPRDTVLMLLGSDLFGYDLTDAITFEAFDFQINGMQALDLDLNQPINLDLPDERLILRQQPTRYSIAQTDAEALIVLRGCYYEDLPGGGLERTLGEIDQAMSESRGLGLTIALLNCGISAGRVEQFELARAAIQIHCADHYLDLKVDFFWNEIRAYSNFSKDFFKLP